MRNLSKTGAVCRTNSSFENCKNCQIAYFTDFLCLKSSYKSIYFGITRVCNILKKQYRIVAIGTGGCKMILDTLLHVCRGGAI